MSNPEIQLNQIPNQPELADLLNFHKKDIFLSMNVHHIGTIQSFNATNQTASATINYTKTFYQLNAQTQTYNPVQLPYPQLIDCPVIVLGGGATSLNFPISQGDECLVLFNDRDMDNWFAGASAGAVASPRLHSFSDGLILVGLRSLNKVISGYDATRALLTDGNAKMGVNPSSHKLLLANNAQNLNTLLQQLITAIKAITVTPGTFMADGNPVVGVSGTPVNVATLTSIASNIGALLE